MSYDLNKVKKRNKIHKKVKPARIPYDLSQATGWPKQNKK